MKFLLLRTFVAVYEEGSLTAAARRVNATQSGISTRIKELEETLGVRLFERSIVGVTPTPHAELVYHRATRILREVCAISHDMVATSAQLTGSVHAGLMPSITRAALSSALDRFTGEHPLVRIKVTEAYSATLVDDVAGGRLDFAIVPPVQAVDGVRARQIATDIELLMTAPNTGRAHLSPVDLSTLGPVKLVLPSPENARRIKIDTYLATHAIDVSAILELDAMMATLDLVATSDWITILPGCLGFPDIDRPEHKLHPLSPTMGGDYVLIESASQALSPAAAAFAAAITAEVSDICAACRNKFASANTRHLNHQNK